MRITPLFACTPAGKPPLHTATMPADATLLFDGAEAELLDLFPGSTVYRSKRTTSDDKPRRSGWAKGYKTTCFVL